MTQTLRTVLLWLAVPLITSPVVGQSLFQLRSPQETGVDFVNEITEDAKRNIIRYQGYYDGGGVALADFNNDGLLDLFFTGNSSPNRLYVNRGNLRFEEITASSGLRETGPGWFTGVSLVDVNQDGWMDLYVCKSGLFNESNRRNKLYVNNGDLTFTEQAADYGLDHAGYSTQAVFFDYDRDNDLDVYLTNYGKPDPSQVLTSAPQMRRQRDPHGGDKLLENVDGRYQDVSQQAVIYEHTWGFAHSAGVGDFNRDGWLDLFVSNDFTEHDFVYLNNQQGGFEERGASVLRHMSNFSMGNDVADFNNDGLPDLVVVDMVAENNKRLKENMSGMQRDEFQRLLDFGYHYQYMFNMLHLNTGAGEFSDIAHLAGISNTDWSWAPLFADFDNDGWKDLYITNGLRRDARNQDARYVFVDLVNQAEQAGRTALTEAEWMKALDAMPSEKLTNYVYRNVNGLRFENRVEAWGLDVASFSNGAAYGDLDNDGDLDLVVNNINDPAFVYENVGGAGKNYLKVALQGPAGNRHGLGAEVSIWARGEQQLMINQWTRGYRSAMAGALHFGLDDAGTVDSVQVKWPDGRVTLAERIPANSTLVVEYTPATVSPRSKAIPKPFSSVDNIAQPAYRHSENLFDDFRREVLLPHTLSALGPFSSVADVNGDGLEDFYIGGAMGRAGSLYLQDSDGSFQIKYLAAFNRDAGFEDMGSHFFDCDQDGDLDLYVVSGGNEQALGGGKYQDRLYLNDGSGSYSHSDGLTEMDFSGSVAVSSDWDGDGDLDLFIGGRQLPGKYPHPVSSVLLRNDGDRFTNVTSTVAPSLEQLGMVTSALWMDHDADGDEDLFVAGEWMPLTLLENRAGQFELTTVSGFANTTGWWFSLASADLDGDGDEDLIAGNVGLNYKYKASDLEPFEVYSSDLDENGKNDIVLAFHEEDNVYPLRGKSCSTEQMPSLKQRYTTYKDFAAADIFEVYGQNKLEEALHLKATLFASTTIENLGDGNFRLQPLPDYAQLSSINGIVTHDVDGDGLLDLIVAGNMYGSEVETVRNDASVGMYLHNQGGMNFEAIAYPASGLYLPGDIKSLRKIQTKEGTLLMAGENQAYLSWVKVHEEGGAAGYSTGIK